MRELQAADALQEAFDCHTGGQWARAEELYCKLIALNEKEWKYPFGLGTLYAQVSAPGRAITFLRRSLELKPDNAEALQNLAAVYRRMENHEESERLNLKALDIDRTPYTLSNMSSVYINAGKPEKALEYADEALAMRPGLAVAGNHRAHALLELGRWEEGWAQYDSRFGIPGFHKRGYTCPQWMGEKVKTLAISGEQGLGDEIMFLTALRQVQELSGAEIVIECAARLVKLIKNSFPECRVYGTYDELAAAEKPDAWTHMGSMQRWIWPVKPNAYLKPSRWTRPMRPRIGLSWHGGTTSTHERLRNCAPALWKSLLGLDANYISLQYGDRADEAAEIGIAHDSEAIADLDRLAERINSCELVITVCNTTVHMAGALGVPCIVLVPSKPAWRYGLSGEKMVWYDSVVMVRQREGESWAAVLARAKQRAGEMLGVNQRELSQA